MQRYAFINTYLENKPLKHEIGKDVEDASRRLKDKHGPDWHINNCLVRQKKGKV